MDHETNSNEDNNSNSPPASMSSRSSRPFDETSDVSSSGVSRSAQPAVLLAPTIGVSPNRDRTLLQEGERKTTPETVGGTKDEDDDDLENGGGRKLFGNASPGGKKKNPRMLSYDAKSNALASSSSSSSGGKGQREESALDRPKKDRTRIVLFGVGIPLLIALIVGLIVYIVARNNGRDFVLASSSAKVPDDEIVSIEEIIPTAGPTTSPTSSPTISPAPTVTPRPTETPSAEPTMFPTPEPTQKPTKRPTRRPTRNPTRNPTAEPTVTPQPTYNPTASPTPDFVLLLEEFLFGDYGVDVTKEENAKAIEWIADEARRRKNPSLNLNGKLVQKFVLLSIELSLRGKVSDLDPPNNALKGVKECEWNGIVCNDAGFVTEINWAYQTKPGSQSTISPEVRLLVGSLKVLDLSNNDLVGNIPEEVYKLTNLERLYLFKNNLQGTISTRIGDLDSLTHFHLSHNNLNGVIPSQLKSGNDIRPLEYFNVYSNDLTGKIPEGLRLRKVKYFDVGRNYMTGTLPVDLGEDFVSLRHLHLDHNMFRQQLPKSYNNVGNGRLETLSIDNNWLTGDIPGERKMYNKLVQYTMQNNFFDRMGTDICKMEIPFGEMVEMRANCDLCRCNSRFFDICDLQCWEEEDEE